MSAQTNNIFPAQDFTFQSGAGANGNGNVMNVGGAPNVTLAISGTFNANVNFEGTADGVNWYPLLGLSMGTAGATPSSSTTQTGFVQVCTAGVDQLRARVSGYVSGAVTVIGKATEATSPYAVASTPLQTDANGTLKTGKVGLGTVQSAGGNVAAAQNNQSIPAAAAKTSYLSGFAVTGLGATAAGSITVTTTGLANNLSFVLPIPAGVTAGVTPLIVTFDPPLPASAPNTAITVNVPSFGAGNTTASCSVWGFQL